MRYPLPQIYWRESAFKEGDRDLLFMLVGKLSQQTSETEGKGLQGSILDEKEGIPRAGIITQKAGWESNNDEDECADRGFCSGSSKVEQTEHQRPASCPNFATSEVQSLIFL